MNQASKIDPPHVMYYGSSLHDAALLRFVDVIYGCNKWGKISVFNMGKILEKLDIFYRFT